MKKLVLLVTTAAVLAVPAAPAPAADIPEINCGIVSCTYQVERKVDGLKECAEGAVRAVEYALQGTPQPQECSLG
jgi:hypothetical protein